jgi:hypothetical protein
VSKQSATNKKKAILRFEAVKIAPLFEVLGVPFIRVLCEWVGAAYGVT